MEISHVREQLMKRGINTIIVPTIEDARREILDIIPAKSSVGIGGSVSIEKSGIYEQLLQKECKVFWHSKCTSASSGALARKQSLSADFFLCSANAVTSDGRIVNIDGKGNRIAAISYGPDVVIFLIGKNKLIDGGLEDAFDHIKRVICPKNARRLGLDLPCGSEKPCLDCTSPQRMCNLNLVIEHAPRGRKYIAVLVDEEMGH